MCLCLCKAAQRAYRGGLGGCYGGTACGGELGTIKVGAAAGAARLELGRAEGDTNDDKTACFRQKSTAAGSNRQPQRP